MMMQALSFMGTDGDMLPLFWSSATLALQHDVPSHLVVQPFQFETVVGKLRSLPCFSWRSEETIAVEQKAYRVTFTPPESCPPKVLRAATADETVQVELRHAVFQTSGQVEFHAWAPADSSWNEKPYQEWEDLHMTAFKKVSYGTFLTKWQAVLAFLDTVLPADGVLRVSNCYDQEGNHKLLEAAVGYECDLHLRIGTLGIMDSNADRNKFYAICQALSPRKVHLTPKIVKEVNPKSMKLEGVITEPTDTFPAEALPSTVAAFLEESTIVVTLSSSQLGTLLQDLLADLRCLFICSVTDAPLPGHLHWPRQLDLDAVFAKACLVVHGCGVGTAYKVVCSGRPSICVTLTKEQLNNAGRLEYKGVAVAFGLRDLMSDTDVQHAFVKSLRMPFDVQCLDALQTQAKKEGDGLAACVEKMVQMLRPPCDTN